MKNHEVHNAVVLFENVAHRVWAFNKQREHAHWLVNPEGLMKLVPVKVLAALPRVEQEAYAAFPAFDALV